MSVKIRVGAIIRAMVPVRVRVSLGVNSVLLLGLGLVLGLFQLLLHLVALDLVGARLGFHFSKLLLDIFELFLKLSVRSVRLKHLQQVA